MSTQVPFLFELDALRDHLATHTLPAPASLDIVHSLVDGMHSTVQLWGITLSEVASALLAWADTLTSVTADMWRVRPGEFVHLQLHGLLSGGLPIKVYSGVAYDADVFGADLEVGARQTVCLGTVRSWAMREVAA